MNRDCLEANHTGEWSKGAGMRHSLSNRPRAFFLAAFLFSGCFLWGQDHFPGKTWDEVNNPEEYGYSRAKLVQAKSYADTIDTAAVLIVVDGRVLYQWGEVSKKYITHSTRKSFLSALFGKYVADGTIDLNKNMGELGIDDEPPLTEQEKTATIRHCLAARSGVYHTAEAETPGMHDVKPERGTYRPGSIRAGLLYSWSFR